MNSYLIYHPKRDCTTIGDLKIYHDKFGGNEDPYIWNERFLHTYCHITQLRNIVNQINFWVSGDSFPNFTKLYCDCVFVIEEKNIWTNKDFIDRSDPIVDNEQAFINHYQWASKGQHEYKKKKRYTLKGHAENSFQPQNDSQNLIDIVPFLNQNNISLNHLVNSMKANTGSKPFKLENDLGQKLYNYLYKNARIKLYGKDLKVLHPYPNGLNDKSNCNYC